MISLSGVIKSRLYTEIKTSSLTFLLMLGLFCIGCPAFGEDYKPTPTKPPQWYTQTPDKGLYVNDVGSDTITALINAIGTLTRKLDPNVERMSESYGDDQGLRENLVRVVAKADFGPISVQSMSQFFRQHQEASFSGGSDLRRIVRIKVPQDGDTTCVYKTYLEEIKSNINTTYLVEPDDTVCSPGQLQTALSQQGIHLVRSQATVVRQYVQLRYLKDVSLRPDALDSDTSSLKTIKQRSLEERKESFEEDMEENLEENRDKRSTKGDTTESKSKDDT